MVEEIYSMLYKALKNGWNVEDLSKLLTDSLDEAVNDFQKNQEKEEKEKLVDELIAIVDDGLREDNWDWNFAAAAMTLYWINDPKDRSTQTIKDLIRQSGVKI